MFKENYSFEEVDIFLRVKGRLPNKEGDGLTQEILDEYCERFERGDLTKGIVDLKYMYDLIKSGAITTTAKKLETLEETPKPKEVLQLRKRRPMARADRRKLNRRKGGRVTFSNLRQQRKQ